MSKNITNGFIFNPTDIMEIHQMISDFRDTLTPLVYDKTVKYFADEVSLKYDTDTLLGSSTHGVFNSVYQRFALQQDEVRVKGVRDPSVDFQFSVLIIPQEHCFYGLFYTEQQDFADLWADLPFVNEYVWYNHRERPENISEVIWSERGDTWDRLLESGGGVPALSGFTYDVISATTNIIPRITDVIKNIPSIKTRTEIMARDRMFKNHCKNKTISSNNMMKIYSGFLEYLESPEGTLLYDNGITDMGNKLQLVITEKDVM